MSTEKLPEWPATEIVFQSVREPYRTNTVLLHVMQERDAALARMEALVEVVERWDRHMRHRIEEDELDAVRALLAACERGKEAGDERTTWSRCNG